MRIPPNTILTSGTNEQFTKSFIATFLSFPGKQEFLESDIDFSTLKDIAFTYLLKWETSESESGVFPYQIPFETFFTSLRNGEISSYKDFRKKLFEMVITQIDHPARLAPESKKDKKVPAKYQSYDFQTDAEIIDFLSGYLQQDTSFEWKVEKMKIRGVIHNIVAYPARLAWVHLQTSREAQMLARWVSYGVVWVLAVGILSALLAKLSGFHFHFGSGTSQVVTLANMGWFDGTPGELAALKWQLSKMVPSDRFHEIQGLLTVCLEKWKIDAGELERVRGLLTGSEGINTGLMKEVERLLAKIAELKSQLPTDGGGWVHALFVSYQIGTDIYQVPQNLASFLQSHGIVLEKASIQDLINALLDGNNRNISHTMKLSQALGVNVDDLAQLRDASPQGRNLPLLDAFKHFKLMVMR